MKPGLRHALVAAAAVFALFAGWRVFGQMQAERHAQAEPERALRWRPDHPLLREATARHIPVWGEVELAWRLRDPEHAAP